MLPLFLGLWCAWQILGRFTCKSEGGCTKIDLRCNWVFRQEMLSKMAVPKIYTIHRSVISNSSFLFISCLKHYSTSESLVRYLIRTINWRTRYRITMFRHNEWVSATFLPTAKPKTPKIKRREEKNVITFEGEASSYFKHHFRYKKTMWIAFFFFFYLAFSISFVHKHFSYITIKIIINFSSSFVLLFFTCFLTFFFCTCTSLTCFFFFYVLCSSSRKAESSLANEEICNFFL